LVDAQAARHGACAAVQPPVSFHFSQARNNGKATLGLSRFHGLVLLLPQAAIDRTS
jgi:hypothetical protein